jgi:predicted ferric reductase
VADYSRYVESEQREGKSIIGCDVYPALLKEPLARRKFVSKGPLTIIALSLVPFLAFLISYVDRPMPSVLLLLAKSTAFLAFGGLSMMFLLSSRFTFIDRMFRGLDKSYFTHHILGIAVTTFIVLHPLFLFLRYGRVTSFSDLYFLPWNGTGFLLGYVAFIVLAVLMFLTMCTRLHYQTWLLTHKGMGAVLVLSFVHAVQVGSDINYSTMVQAVTWAYFAVGFSCFLYKLLLYTRTAPHTTGRVERVLDLGSVIDVIVAVDDTAPGLRPGMFFYIDLLISRGESELHPFSVSSIRDGRIRFSIKKSGDHTRRIDPSLEGEHIRMYGPYGAIANAYLSSSRPMLWIAGGIGITPFLSMLEHEKRRPSGKSITLIWSVTKIEEAHYTKELDEIASSLDNVTYMLWLSGRLGRLTVDGVHDHADVDISSSIIVLCGPLHMMYDLSRQFMERGVSSHDIIFESFDYRYE